MRRVSLCILLALSLFAATGCPQELEEEGQAPVITLPDGIIYSLELGESLVLSPGFAFLDDLSTVRWLSNGAVVGTGPSFTFTPSETGVYYITVEAVNPYGQAFLEVRVNVWQQAPQPPMPQPPEPDNPLFVFDQTEYHVTLGRTIRLLPFDLDTTRHYFFSWRIDGTTVQQGDDPLYRFEARSQGRYSVGFTLTGDDGTSADTTLTVLVCPVEGTYRRAASANSSAHCDKVLCFTPAPGQYVNENYTATTMDEACKYAIARIKDDKYVSLGGFGGFIVVGFDHSVANDGGYNLAIRNSLYTNYSEPGIVWVMQDEDGNGLPDDTWYELKGSEYGLDCTAQDYAVTYYRPDAPGQPVAWTDNLGGSGSVDYLAAFHTQDYYYPLWVKEPRYTLRGTRLEARNYDQSGRGVLWINPDYGWGYADNYSETDMFPGGKTGDGDSCNHFRISDAVTFDGKPANLQYIDFVKVQTGLNTKSGWLGEVSTEVVDVLDYNLVK